MGAEGPIEFEMMRVWERQPPVVGGCEEWAIRYSPGRKFAVVYMLYELDHVPGPTTLTYFRIVEGRPIFVRHDVVPGMAYYAVGDDGTCVTVDSDYSMMWWHIRALDGASAWGTLLQLEMDLKAQPDGTFIISSAFGEYRLSMADGKASITTIDFHVGEKFYRNTYCEPMALLPVGISPVVALDFARSLEALAAKAEDVLAAHPTDAGALYVRKFAKEAIPILRDSAMPYTKSRPIELPEVQAFVETILEDPHPNPPPDEQAK